MSCAEEDARKAVESFQGEYNQMPAHVFCAEGQRKKICVACQEQEKPWNGKPEESSCMEMVLESVGASQNYHDGNLLPREPISRDLYRRTLESALGAAAVWKA